MEPQMNADKRRLVNSDLRNYLFHSFKTMILLKNLIYNKYFISTLRSSRTLRCLILFTAEDVKAAKTSLKWIVYNYNRLSAFICVHLRLNFRFKQPSIEFLECKEIKCRGV